MLSKTLVVVELNKSGTGWELVQSARACGARVIVATRNVSYYPELALPLDGVEILSCDTENIGALQTAIAPYHPTCVTAVGDHYVTQAAAVAHRLQARGLGPVVARLGRDKWAIHSYLAAEGVPLPWMRRVSSAAELIPDLPLPAVVKPSDGTGSELVLFCESAAEVHAAFVRIDGERTNHRGQSRPGGALVAEYVAGPEFSVEALVCRGSVHIVGVTEKTLLDERHFIEMGHHFPVCDAKLAAQCSSYAQLVLEALRIEYGAVHVEVRMTERGPLLIEINFRAAGDGITELIALATGDDFIEGWRDCLLGEGPTARWAARQVASVQFERPAAGVDLASGNDARGARRVFLSSIEDGAPEDA